MKKMTLADLAKEAGVSRAVVGRVLLNSGNGIRVGEKTAERIRSIALKHNYVPNITAQQLAGKKSKCIGVLIDSCAHYVSYRKLAAIEMQLDQRGYRVMIGQAHNNPQKMITYVEDFFSRGIEGIISFCAFYKEHIEKFDKRKNILYLGTLLKDRPSVAIDTSFGVKLLVRHLLARGRKKIGIVLFNPLCVPSILREKGYCEALQDSSVPVNQDLVYKIHDVFDPKLLDDAIIELVHRRKADAIVANNDVGAVYLVKKLQAMGLHVPRDVAVTGFDNDDISWVCSPGITTISQQEDKVAELTAELIIELSNKGSIPENKMQNIIEPELIIREST